MSHVTLVRHGQANTQARDEIAYDRLSDMGWQQARWLGEHLRATGERFARVYSGTLRRHVETAEAIAADCAAAPVRDARLNEMAYFDLAKLVEAQHGLTVPDDREGFVAHLPKVFDLWQTGRVEAPPEPFETFEARTRAALQEIAEGEGRALVVTSGGVIGMVLRHVLRLDLRATAHACLAIENTSLHRVQPLKDGLLMTQFNALPHLEAPERQFARSHL
ncbi:histidine phosphatase family protein [Sagittula salina]|uniref:Histidine phosphatase family protein n=1 Tax=Sagittula salina TaxID=2820268 RepID=A0A940S222_9RHOB|nr:histidine phosphatase family protein [Sagittula salina]MBP0483662.1 histidine phosphatase family protein [Sagittula salina]